MVWEAAEYHNFHYVCEKTSTNNIPSILGRQKEIQEHLKASNYDNILRPQ